MTNEEVSVTPLPETATTLASFSTPTLGDRSYLLHDENTAIAIDPQRDIERFLSYLTENKLTLTHVFETHIHNDYVTGGFALAQETGAVYHVNKEDNVSFSRHPIEANEVVNFNDTLQIRAIATPGHTFTHLSYALEWKDTEATALVFTGGSLLFGTTGRPDLLGTNHQHELASHQYDSVKKLSELRPEASILPTHGFGSFCSSQQASGTESTIQHEKETNSVFFLSKEEWIEEILAGLTPYPKYYAHMAPANSVGPIAVEIALPNEATIATIRESLLKGEWVVDLRDRKIFAAGHVKGSFNFGLQGSFATYLGWLIPWNTPLTLLATTQEEILEAQKELSRIGIENIKAQKTGSLDSWTLAPETFQTATFEDLAHAMRHRELFVLDVRRKDEVAESALAMSFNIPLQDLLTRLPVLKQLVEANPREIWVHCASGYRASVAASLVAAAGLKVVAVDDDYAQAGALGLLG